MTSPAIQAAEKAQKAQRNSSEVSISLTFIYVSVFSRNSMRRLMTLKYDFIK